MCLAWDMQRADARTDWSLDRPSRLQGRAFHAAGTAARQRVLSGPARLAGRCRGWRDRHADERDRPGCARSDLRHSDRCAPQRQRDRQSLGGDDRAGGGRPAAGPDGMVAPALEDLQRGRSD